LRRAVYESPAPKFRESSENTAAPVCRIAKESQVPADSMDSELINVEKGLEENYWWFIGRRAIIEGVLRRIVPRTRLAVDVGCGSGRNMLMLSHYTDRVMGFDRSPAALALAAARGFPIAYADGHSVPLADSSADLLCAFDVLEHLDDDMQALSEFHRVLEPKGFLLLTVPAYRFLWSEHDEALMHRRRYSASELHVKLTRSRFVVLKRSYAVFFPFFPIVLYRLFRGLFPKNPFAPRASHVPLPAVGNKLLIALLKIEAWMMGGINLPWGTSIVVLAQKIPADTKGAEFID
jgi:SAM-dependent methyltransferase